jgi:hypothetical protein
MKKSVNTFTTADPLERESLLVGSGSAVMSFSTQWVSSDQTHKEREREMRERWKKCQLEEEASLKMELLMEDGEFQPQQKWSLERRCKEHPVV